VMSQAMSAAQQTVKPEFVLHSMHAYFMRPGDPARAVIYDVELIREGKSFITRRVVARQHGAAIFSCQLSYQKIETGFDHQVPMPPVPGPEGLRNESELFAAVLVEGETDRILPPTDWPVEHFPLDPVDLKNPQVHEPRTYVWLKAAAPLPDDLALHQQLLAFASDHNILVTALRPHATSIMTPGLQIATIDHGMWFHRPFRIDDWLLYESESPSASNARGFSLGRVYTRAGILVASISQEGLIRQRSPQ